MTVPPEAITAAAKAYHNDVFDAADGYSSCSCSDRDEHDERWHADVVASRQALTAAAPLIAAAERDRWRLVAKAAVERITELENRIAYLGGYVDDDEPDFDRAFADLLRGDQP